MRSLLARLTLLAISTLLVVLLGVLVVGYWSISGDRSAAARVAVSGPFRSAAKTERALYSLAARPDMHDTSERSHLNEIRFRQVAGAMWLWVFWTRDDVAELVVNKLRYLQKFTDLSEVTNICFGVEPTGIDHIQAATLLSIARSPSAYQKGENAERLLESRNRLLAQMAGQGALDPDQLPDLVAQPLDACWD